MGYGSKKSQEAGSGVRGVMGDKAVKVEVPPFKVEGVLSKDPSRGGMRHVDVRDCRS